jgi:hypothetical protein
MVRMVHKYTCGLIFIFMLGYFFSTKDFKIPYDKVVMAEGLGYYAYLPATFIYHDYTFNFFNKVYPRYFQGGFQPPTRNFINEFDGIRLNKYYPGVSLLWLPFFLIAHLLALLFHLRADGYSDIYHYAIGMAGIFYTYLGVKFTRKILLQFNIPLPIQTLVLIASTVGTNLLIYAACWSSQTHCYSFFLIAAFCWFVLQLSAEEKAKAPYYLCMCFIFFALIFTTRPQDIIILLLLPFLGVNKSLLLKIKSRIFSALSIFGLIIAILLVIRVCYYWFIQTGNVILNPYQGEHYYFNQPHTWEALFSYRKGWLLYSPYVAFGLLGIFLFKRNRDKINLFLFWSILIYVTSCWWCWHFSPTSFGQRPYIDFYSLIALQSAVFFNSIKNKILKWASFTLAFLTIPLSLLQTHQYKHGIIDGNYYSSEPYWKNFFSISPVAYFPIPPETIIKKEEYFLNFENDLKISRTNSLSYSGNVSTFTSANNEFSDGQKFVLPSFITYDEYSKIRVTSKIKPSAKQLGEVNLVIDISKEGKSLKYYSFNVNSYIRNLKWKEFQQGISIPVECINADSVSIYFWRPKRNGNDSLYIDDLKIEIIHMNKSYDETKNN